jgi:hypothetical protein
MAGYVLLATASNSVFSGVAKNDLLFYTPSNRSLYLGPSNSTNYMQINSNNVQIAGNLNVIGNLMQNGSIFTGSGGGGGFTGSSLSISGPVACSFLSVTNGATQGVSSSNSSSTGVSIVTGQGSAFTGIGSNGTTGSNGIALNLVNSNAYANIVVWNSNGTATSEIARFAQSNGSNYVGIGTSAPAFNLDVVGTTRTGALLYTSLNQTSDARVKENVTPVIAKWAETTLSQLRVVNYNLIGQDQVANKTIGFIAQEVEPILPQALRTICDFVPLDTPIEGIINELTDETGDKKITHTLSIDCDGTKQLKVGGTYKLASNQSFVVSSIELNNDVLHTIYDIASTSPLASGPVTIISELVDDFKTLDYSTIQNCTVAVVQNLIKRVAALERRVL